jgi:hypothetical protein
VLLESRKTDLDTSINTFTIIQAAIFFWEWELYTQFAATMALLRFFFIEQKNCPNDLLLTTVWQLTSRWSDCPLRSVLLSSLWRKLFQDGDYDEQAFSKKFFVMYKEDATFVDIRPNSWFSDFHAFCQEWLNSSMDKLFYQLCQRRPNPPPTLSNAFLTYVCIIRINPFRTPTKRMRNDSTITPALSGFRPLAGQKRGITGLHLRFLQNLEVNNYRGFQLTRPGMTSSTDVASASSAATRQAATNTNTSEAPDSSDEAAATDEAEARPESRLLSSESASKYTTLSEDAIERRSSREERPAKKRRISWSTTQTGDQTQIESPVQSNSETTAEARPGQVKKDEIGTQASASGSSPNVPANPALPATSAVSAISAVTEQYFAPGLVSLMVLDRRISDTEAYFGDVVVETASHPKRPWENTQVSLPFARLQTYSPLFSSYSTAADVPP